MTNNLTYKQEDIFQNIEGDNENVLMTIPPEVCEKMGWQPGDHLKIEILKEGEISITKAEDG